MVAAAIRNGWLSSQRSALLRLHAFAARLGRGPKLPGHLATGMRGELEALFYLRRLGYTVVARRWRTPELRGDLDLVAWDGEVLCFVEVKARTARDLAPAESAVDREKKTMLRQMARAYLRRISKQERAELSLRFDVVCVYLLKDKAENKRPQPEFEIFRDAFGWH